MFCQTENSGELKIPKDYNKLCRFIAENKGKILRDWKAVIKILDTLDCLLADAENLSDLHRDTSIILETIKLQQDALLREYRNNLSIGQLAAQANKGDLDEFFEMVKSQSLAVKFVDQISFSFKPKEQQDRLARTVYDVCKGPARVPDSVVATDDLNEQAVLVQQIRDVVLQHGQVEYFHLIIDPDSYSKTVYNSFNLALAVRMKALSLKSDNGQVFVTQYAPGGADIGHSALHLTEKQVKHISKNLGLKEPLL